ncbi:MAG: type transport system permease protein [Actinomycetota bacterium]|jgi:ABC-2 type transport system permease protein|nr:type transport system permease protein [Actinomycetota bacterium]
MSETGVIHDIGYRHYDGPRLGLRYITRSLFVSSLKGAYGFGRSARSKVMPLLLLGVITLPAFVIAAIVTIGSLDTLPLQYTQYAARLQLLIAIFVAGQAPQMVSRDLRFGVVALYFSRPLTRQSYVQAKYAAMAAALFVLVTIPLLVLYVGALLAKLPVRQQTSDLAYGLVGAALLALVLAGIGLVIAAFTPRRGLGVAAVIAVLLVATGVAATLQGVARDQGNDTIAGYAGLISPFTLVDGVQVWAFGSDPASLAGPPGTTGGLVCLAVTLAVIAGTYGLLLLRYRRVSVS